MPAAPEVGIGAGAVQGAARTVARPEERRRRADSCTF
jgi:hypothetical protein